MGLSVKVLMYLYLQIKWTNKQDWDSWFWQNKTLYGQTCLYNCPTFVQHCALCRQNTINWNQYFIFQISCFVLAFILWDITDYTLTFTYSSFLSHWMWLSCSYDFLHILWHTVPAGSALHRNFVTVSSRGPQVQLIKDLWVQMETKTALVSQKHHVEIRQLDRWSVASHITGTVTKR